MECQACSKELTKSELIKCVVCEGLYHYKCLNMSSAYYVEHLHKLKKTWRCPACENVTSRRKGGDTPVRHQFISDTAFNMSCDDLATDPPIKTSQSEVISYQQFALLLESKLEVMKASLTREIRNELASALERIKSDFTATTDFLSNQISELKQEITSYKTKFRDIENEKQSLQMSISQLQLQLNIKEQESLANDLQISGIPEIDNESLTHLVATVATKIGVKVSDMDIVSVARVGAKQATADPTSSGHKFRPRPIVVRLARRSVRDELLKNARIRRGANTGDLGLPSHEPKRFYINERLTKTSRQIFAKAREAARIAKWRFVWTKEGRVYARWSESSKVLLLQSESDVDKIVSNANSSYVDIH